MQKLENPHLKTCTKITVCKVWSKTLGSCHQEVMGWILNDFLFTVCVWSDQLGYNAVVKYLLSTLYDARYLRFSHRRKILWGYRA